VTEADDWLEPSALTATTFSTVGPWPTRNRTDQLPSGRTATCSPFAVTFAPWDAVPEICTSRDPVFTMLTMLTFARDSNIGSSIPFVGSRRDHGLPLATCYVRTAASDRPLTDKQWIAYWLICATFDATATLFSEPNEKAFAVCVTSATCVIGAMVTSRIDGK
jgi:hypothetical protein